MSFEHWDMVESMRNTNRKYHQSATRNTTAASRNTTGPPAGIQSLRHSEYHGRQPEYYRTTSRNTVTPSLGIHTEMVFVSIYYHYY